MTGLLLLWLVIKEVCTFSPAYHIALFSDNQPTVYWVKQLTLKSSRVVGQLLRALALWLKCKSTFPLTTLHIKGERNAMTDIPS
jgi:hypothetical protein